MTRWQARGGAGEKHDGPVTRTLTGRSRLAYLTSRNGLSLLPPRPAIPRRLGEPLPLGAEPLSRRPRRASDRWASRGDAHGRHPGDRHLLHLADRDADGPPQRDP